MDLKKVSLLAIKIILIAIVLIMLLEAIDRNRTIHLPQWLQFRTSYANFAGIIFFTAFIARRFKKLNPDKFVIGLGIFLSIAATIIETTPLWRNNTLDIGDLPIAYLTIILTCCLHVMHE